MGTAVEVRAALGTGAAIRAALGTGAAVRAAVAAGDGKVAAGSVPLWACSGWAGAAALDKAFAAALDTAFAAGAASAEDEALLALSFFGFLGLSGHFWAGALVGVSRQRLRRLTSGVSGVFKSDGVPGVAVFFVVSRRLFAPGFSSPSLKPWLV